VSESPSIKNKIGAPRGKASVAIAFLAAAVLGSLAEAIGADRPTPQLVSIDVRLRRALKRAGFTGRVGSTLERRLGRPVDPTLAALGNQLFFDPILSLRTDNACAGCHSPAHGFGDSQSIAIGVQNNGIVGAGRRGPRNQRRSPMVLNSAFYPNLMWNGRFRSTSGDPFDNSQGFAFPPPEGTTRFPPHDPSVTHLLAAQAHIPSTELVEMAGFKGMGGPFDDGYGHSVPAVDASGYANEPIRAAVLALVNATPAYRQAFGALFPGVAQGDAINFAMIGQAIAEFEMTLTFADAPIDRFMRGDSAAMTDSQKRGALLFFGQFGCARCHAVAGAANEMFSDFKMHVVAIPQIAPVYGPNLGNVRLAGPGEDEDFGLEDITGDPADRYKFRTTPLRNVALQPAFFHNGAFTSLEAAIFHYVNPADSARGYDPAQAGIAPDLTARMGPIEPVIEHLSPLLEPMHVKQQQLNDLVAFVREGLLDSRATPENLLRLVPASLPSGLPGLVFEAPPP
jgi:cytochrome c peroxidase